MDTSYSGICEDSKEQSNQDCIKGPGIQIQRYVTILDNIQCMYVQLIQCPVDNCADDEEENEKNALYLMVSLMLRGDPEENLRMVYEEHQVRKTGYYYGDLK